ncbi:MAG: adenylyltransferase/cytidyltransferase family protein [Candidatus Latescibacterota bacterium]|jgi:D-beta-D-heptose 7-phosphate kinase/D-beta-D-heptose 1-phosphate adenosyltransferase
MAAPPSRAKIVSRPVLLALRLRLRREGRIVVFTNGCFDLVHRAHVEYLREARRLGDLLVVGLNDDDAVRALKGPGRPLMTAADRAVILAELESVDYVCVFPEVSVRGLVADLLPDVLVKGGDYRPEEIVGREEVERTGGVVRAVSHWPGCSTSSLIERVRSLPA